MIINRLARLRDWLKEKNIPAVIVSKEENIRYFSGFTGDDTLLAITAQDAILLTDSRYTEQAAKEAPLFEIVEQKDGLLPTVASTIKKLRVLRCAFEGNSLTYNQYTKLSQSLSPIKFDAPVNLDFARMIKEAEETEKIRRAAVIADMAFSDILKFIRPGVSENAVAARLENTMRTLGSEKPSFPTIVASGERGSLPHGMATEKLLNRGEFVTMDYGAVYDGYHSDMTRTVCIGPADDRQREIYAAVLEAQELGVSLIRPGAGGIAVDKAVREKLHEKNLAKYFGHGLGHSVGLEIHEEPRLSPKSTCNGLAIGMTVAVEPGVYITGWGGVRIEDLLLVTAAGAEILTKSEKRLLEIEN